MRIYFFFLEGNSGWEVCMCVGMWVKFKLLIHFSRQLKKSWIGFMLRKHY